MKKETEFQKELASLLNKYSQENESNTPDFILAEYLVGCLKTFNHTLKNRNTWFKTDAAGTQIKQ